VRELFRFGLDAVRGQGLRSSLSVLGVAIGISAVSLLTAIGEGTRTYVLSQFLQFGTNILSVNPGKTDTLGIPGMLGGTTHKLTIEDAMAIRRLPGVEAVVPLCVSQARVAAWGRGRNVFVYGVSREMPAVWSFQLGIGSFLPEGDPRRGADVCVLGPKLAAELFGEENPLGERVRVGGRRLRVIGVMQPKGQILGIDLDDAAYLPVATAMQIFNRDELEEINVLYSHAGLTDSLVEEIRRLLIARHRGKEDFTITTQQAMLEVFGKVMRAITIGVGAIGGISLLVGAIGILTMMWISVGERTAEIGLLRAVGASAAEVQRVFLWEALVLSLLGGLAGVLAALAVAGLLRALFPGLPLGASPAFVLAALALSAGTGLASGALPARRAARLDPVDALRSE
jgi:putative ABC transport system permease protein